jgi:hypothetical protein
LKASKIKTARGGPRIDWKSERDLIDLVTVATDLLGTPPGRRGGRGRRLWWLCPFHEDRNPSLAIDPDKPWWRCYGCEEKGDAATLVMKLRGVTFPEAVAYLTGGPASSKQPKTKPESAHRLVAPAKPAPQTSGMSPEDALALVETAAARLWTPEGATALAYLTSPRRCLKPETIRAARLGETTPLDLPGRPRGVVIPWFVGQAPALVKVRQPTGRRPKYHEAFRDLGRHIGIFPGPTVIRPGHPLVVAEGEFDALLLGQELGDLAAVVTLGSASSGRRTRTSIDPEILGKLLSASPWYIATDADSAGDEAAAGWPASARRVRLPSPYKDWTEAAAGGVDLRRWWADVLSGNTPALAPGPLGTLLSKLNARGVRLDGSLVHPQIAVTAVTGRVTYAGIDPPPQGIPTAERLHRIRPIVEGRVFVRADFGQIEPRILLKILRDRGLITWDVAPEEDLYRVLIADPSIDRDTIKPMVNKVVNGGRHKGPATGRFAEFIRAADTYRRKLEAETRTKEYVRTLAGHTILLGTDEDNFGGRAVNRVVQGTASDIFNRACVAVVRAIEAEGLPAAVAFLLFDELWVECDPAVVIAVAELVRVEMEAAALADGVTVPVRFAADPPPLMARASPVPVYTWEELATWRWGPTIGETTPDLVIDRSDSAGMRAALRALALDPEAMAEREAIRVGEELASAQSIG